jgi:hypothetical protein
VDLSHDDLNGADLTSSDLRWANLSWTNLQSAHLSRSNLARANLRNANLKGASLIRANLAGACLQGAELQGADLSHADLSCADVTGANLSSVDLTQANLSQADLTRASLSHATLIGTILDIANLTEADLRDASLVHSSLDGTLLIEARLEMTLFGDCDLSQALGLDAARHSGPSIIGLDTLARSMGKIPSDFLRQAGVSATLVEVQKLLRNGASQFPRVLLLGSVKDGEFIQQLQKDLSAAGLACWYLPVDDEEVLLNDGADPLVQRLVYYDQVLLVCSEHSLESPYGWRFFEQVSQSRSRGGGHRKVVVVLNLDNCLNTKQDRLCEELHRYAPMDFSGWEEDGAYDRFLEGLITALRAEDRPADPFRVSDVGSD